MRNPDDIYDEWLVLRCQGGDAEALAILVKRWQPRLLAFATRMLGDRDAAEDAVQSSWVDVVRRIKSVQDPSALRPWLFRIVANKCTDFVRRRVRQRNKESVTETHQVPDPSAANREAHEEQSAKVRLLQTAMKTLDEGRREILRLHYLDGLSIDKIAKRLSIPSGTVKSRLHHARNKLKESLSGEST